MAKSRRTEKQDFMRRHKAQSAEEQAEEERQRKIGKAVRTAYWAHVLFIEAQRE